MINEQTDKFKTLRGQLEKSGAGFYIEPEEGYLYDGIIETPNYEQKMYAKDFYCPRCKGNNCAVCPCSSGKKYLMCRNHKCAYEIAEVNKEPGRRAFKASLERY